MWRHSVVVATSLCDFSEIERLGFIQQESGLAFKKGTILLEQIKPKSLFLVFDLNGILCKTENWRNFPNLKSHERGTYSDIVPVRVENKAVFCRTNVREFIERVSDFAYVIIWSSMMGFNVEAVAAFLFEDLPSPIFLWNQDHCETLRDPTRKTFTDVCGRATPQRLKNLSRLWFIRENISDFCPPGVYPSPLNTLLIDDTPAKCIRNPINNCLFLPTWEGAHCTDFDLLAVVLPFLRDLANSQCPVPEYMSKNRIGLEGMDQNSAVYKDLMKLANKNSR